MRKDLLKLADIKRAITNIKGQDINIEVNRGRKKIESYLGVVVGVYPSVFTVELKNSLTMKNVTCSYSDVLCGDVKISKR